MGLDIMNLAMTGGAILALYEGVVIVTKAPLLFSPDPIHDFLVSLIPGGNGDGDGCTLQCTAPQVLNTATCTCQNPAGCTLQCTAPQVLNETTCTCQNPSTGCTLTCTAPQVLNTATCTCQTPTTGGCTDDPVTHLATGCPQYNNVKWSCDPLDNGGAGQCKSPTEPRICPAGDVCCECKNSHGRTTCPTGGCCTACNTVCAHCPGFTGVAYAHARRASIMRAKAMANAGYAAPMIRRW